MNKTAVIVISHNDKQLTDSICENIIRNTKTPYELFVVETGSDLDKISSYTTLWVKDKIRMTRGFNRGIEYAFWKETWEDVHYDSFWCLVNDANLQDGIDNLSILKNEMLSSLSCGGIHPHINNSRAVFQKREGDAPSKETSFMEIVCPMFSRKAIELKLFDDRFFYGWGLDYEIPYLMHKNGMRMRKSNTIGVIHDSGTTVKKNNDQAIKSQKQQFDISRNNMMEVLESKYGKNWGHVFLDAIPNEVPKDAFIEWVTKIGRNYRF